MSARSPGTLRPGGSGVSAEEDWGRRLEGDDVQRRRLVVAACLIVAAVGTAIGWVYTHPPLSSSGYSTRHDGEGTPLAHGVDLVNNGRWPLTLVAVTVDGQEILPPHAIAVANFTDGELAGSAAITMEREGHKLTKGPVYDWKMQPARRVGRSRYAIRLDTSGFPAEFRKIIVHYRYLGLPMRYDITPWR